MTVSLRCANNAVTDPLGRIVRPGFEARAPRTASEFVTAFQQSVFSDGVLDKVRLARRLVLGCWG